MILLPKPQCFCIISISSGANFPGFNKMESGMPIFRCHAVGPACSSMSAFHFKPQFLADECA